MYCEGWKLGTVGPWVALDAIGAWEWGAWTWIVWGTRWAGSETVRDGEEGGLGVDGDGKKGY
jgi:hypothetical protein